MHTRTIPTPYELHELADELLSLLPASDRAHTLALSGPLGAGKTTFAQALAHVLGVTEQVISPTFLIMRTYPTAHRRFMRLVHIDAYRVEDEEELRILNLSDYFAAPETLVCIEWPERIPSFVPADALRLSFEIAPEDVRIVTYG